MGKEKTAHHGRSSRSKLELDGDSQQQQYRAIHLVRCCTVDPEGDQGSMQYFNTGLYPVRAPSKLVTVWQGKLPSGLWVEISERSKDKSLRSLAKEYGVSYETIRRTLRAVNVTTSEKPR